MTTLPAPAGPHLLDVSAFWNATGGVRRVLATKHHYLQAHGWRHTVMAPGVQGAGHIDCGGWTLPATGGYRLTLRSGLAARLIEQAQPDIVEAADPYTLAWAALRASDRLGIPAVAFCHSDLPMVAARLIGGLDGMGTRRGRFAARRARDYLVRLYAHFDLVLAPSRSMAERLVGWGVRQAAVQPLGVDCTVFAPSRGDPAFRDHLMRRLGLAPATKLLVYSGRFAPEKNLPLLCEAVRLLGPGHALLAVGAGPQPPQGPGVFVLPPERDSKRLARLVASCDAYVHAGDQETFGLGVLEAMACGTPVVVSSAGGLGELAHEVGITVARRRAHEWADAIGDCLNEAAPPRTQRAFAALTRAHEHDWSRVLQQWLRRYQTLLRAGAPASAHGAHGADIGRVAPHSLARVLSVPS